MAILKDVFSVTIFLAELRVMDWVLSIRSMALAMTDLATDF